MIDLNPLKKSYLKYKQVKPLGMNDKMPDGCKYEGKLISALIINNPSYILKVHDARILNFESVVIDAAETKEYANNVGREFYE